MGENGKLDKLKAQLNHHAGIGGSTMFLYRLNAADWTAPAGGVEPAARWTLLKPFEIPLLTSVSEPNLQEAEKRLKRGDACYVAWIGGRMAHHSWVQTSGEHPVTEAGVTRPVGPGEFWIYHCHTAEWARGRKLYPTALARILNEHFGRGFHTAWIYTQDHNVVSQQGIERSQFARTTTLRALRAGRYYLPLGEA
jgi:hypothetical protein